MMVAFSLYFFMAMIGLLGDSTSAFSLLPTMGARQTRMHRMTMLGSLDGRQGVDIDTSSTMCRRDALGTLLLGVAASPLVFSAAADAKEDPALKGTKDDPEFVKCVSDCIYFCTKEKQPAKSRTECIPECRKSCAKTKAQQLVGKPRE